MAEYYVDPTATGDDTGASKTNAWTTMQRCEDGTDGTQPAAGDTVLFRHSGAVGAADETIGAGGIDIDGNAGDSGAAGSGYIRYIGVNSAWENDGTQYVLDGNSATVASGIWVMAVGTNYRWFENFLVTKSATSGITAIDVCNYCIFKNVTASLNASTGITADNIRVSVFQNCSTITNDSDGFTGLRGRAIRCVSAGNGFSGFTLSTLGVLLDSISAGNTISGVYVFSSGAAVIGNVIDGNGSLGIYGSEGSASIIEDNRITHNASYGAHYNGPIDGAFLSRNVFYGNRVAAIYRGMEDDGTCHGDVGDTSIVTVANRDVTEDGYTKHTWLLTVTEVSGDWQDVAVGDTIDGLTWTGTVVSAPTAETDGTMECLTLTGVPAVAEVEIGSVGLDVTAVAIQLEGDNATDYTLTRDAVLRRSAVAIDDTHSVYTTAGFAPSDLSHRGNVIGA